MTAELWAQTATLQVSGRHIRDRCGNVLVLRGLEQNQTVNVNGGTIINGSWDALVDQADTTRANQIRLILEDVNVAQTRQMVERAVSKNLVVEIHTSIGYYNQSAVQQMVAANRSHLILGIFGEPAYNDRARWQNETMSAAAAVHGCRVLCELRREHGEPGADGERLSVFPEQVRGGGIRTRTAMGAR